MDCAHIVSSYCSCTPGLMYCTDWYGNHHADIAGDEKGRHNLAPPPPPPPQSHSLVQTCRDIDRIFRKLPHNEIFSLIYYKQLDLLSIQIGWMVLEIWENPPNLADSLGIESELFKYPPNGIVQPNKSGFHNLNSSCGSLVSTPSLAHRSIF